MEQGSQFSQVGVVWPISICPQTLGLVQKWKQFLMSNNSFYFFLKFEQLFFSLICEACERFSAKGYERQDKVNALLTDSWPRK